MASMSSAAASRSADQAMQTAITMPDLSFLSLQFDVCASGTFQYAHNEDRIIVHLQILQIIRLSFSHRLVWQQFGLKKKKHYSFIVLKKKKKTQKINMQFASCG